MIEDITMAVEKSWKAEKLAWRRITKSYESKRSS
jgi:hypothetical protein